MKRVIELDWHKIWREVDEWTKALDDPRSLVRRDYEDQQVLQEDLKSQIELWVNDDLRHEAQ